MRSLFLSLVFVVSSTSSVLSQQITFQGLGYLPGGSVDSWARGASADGSVVVGESKNASGLYEAFRWTASTGTVGLGSVPGGADAQSSAYGVSADGGVIVGNGGGRAFRWTSTTGMMALDHVAGARESANAVSSDGQVVVGSRGLSVNNVQASRWTPSYQSLGMLPNGLSLSDAYAVSADGQTIVGRAESGQGGEAFRWTPTTGMQLLGPQPGGGHNSTAHSVSADGTTIVGVYSGGGTQAFRWTESTGMVGLGYLDPAFPQSEAFAISADGSVIVGNSRTSPLFMEAFVWLEGTGMQNLKTLLIDGGADLSGWRNLHAWAISADGQTIVGIGHRASPTGMEVREAWIATIPEPSSGVLVAVSLLAVMVSWRLALRRQVPAGRDHGRLR